MGRLRKKETAATSAQGTFMTRSEAVRKLQISLAHFRKLCILKGIYPREPTNKRKGRDKTYYLTKDIMFLNHDPVLSRLREQKTWLKRLAKARGRKEKDREQFLLDNKPEYELDHIIRERYPTFPDALRDMDDALSMLFLFASLPSSSKVQKKTIDMCRRLILEFQSWVMREKALRKVFVSIKGIYYQADIAGTPVTWIIPHQFQQDIPEEVDHRVMLSFLELYTILVGFVNFRLYHCSGLYYPPVFDSEKELAGDSLFAMLLDSNAPMDTASSTTTSSSSSKSKKPTVSRLNEIENKISSIVADEDDENNDESESESESTNEEESVFKVELSEQEKDEERLQKLFSGLKIFLSREVPRESLQFVIQCFGGEVSWEGPTAPFPETDDAITHQIVDRGSQRHRYLDRDYVQPQWIYDSVNARVLLPLTGYAPNEQLPAHLSPFVNEDEEGYIPQRAQEIKEIRARILSGQSPDEYEQSTKAPANQEDEEEDEDEEAVEERFQRELAAERKGITYSNASKSDNKKKQKKSAKIVADDEDEDDDDDEDEDEDEEEEEAPKLTAAQRKKAAEEAERKKLAEIMIPSRKQQRLYHRLERRNNIVEEKRQKLVDKRRQLDKEKKQQQSKKKGAAAKQ